MSGEGLSFVTISPSPRAQLQYEFLLGLNASLVLPMRCSFKSVLQVRKIHREDEDPVPVLVASVRREVCWV
jgi:hypothetical protein